MVRLGENPGKYTLENVQNGESEVCGKKSCYMNFRQVFNDNKLGFPVLPEGRVRTGRDGGCFWPEAAVRLRP